MIKKFFLGVFSIASISTLAVAGFSNLSGQNNASIFGNNYSYSDEEFPVIEVSSIDDIKNALDDSQTDNVFSIELVNDIDLTSYNPTEQYLDSYYEFSYFEIDGNGYSFKNKNENNFFKPLFGEIDLNGNSDNEFATFYVHDLVFDNTAFIFNQINYKINYSSNADNSTSKIGQNSLSFQNIEFKNIDLDNIYTLTNEREMTEDSVKNYGLLFNNLTLTSEFSNSSDSQFVSNSGVYFNNIFIDNNSIDTSVYSDLSLSTGDVPLVNLHELLFSPLGTITFLNVEKNTNFSGQVINFSNIYIWENDFDFKFYLNQKVLDPDDPSYGVSTLYNLGVSSLFNIIVFDKSENNIEIGFKDIFLQNNYFNFQTKNHFNTYNLGYLNNSTSLYSSNFNVSSLENIFIYENNLNYTGDVTSTSLKNNYSQKDVYVLRTYLFASDVANDLQSILNNVLIINDSLRDDKIFLSYDSVDSHKISTYSKISDEQISNVESTFQNENISYIKNLNSNGEFEGFSIGTNSEQLVFHNLRFHGRKQWGKKNIKKIQFNYYLFNNVNKNALSIDDLTIYDQNGHEYFSGQNYQNNYVEIKLKKTTQEKLSNSNVEISYSFYDYQNDLTTTNNSIYISSDQLSDSIERNLTNDSFIFWNSTAAIFMYLILFIIIIIAIILMFHYFGSKNKSPNKVKAKKVKDPKTNSVKKSKTQKTQKTKQKTTKNNPNNKKAKNNNYSKKAKKASSIPVANNQEFNYQNMETEYFDNYQDLNYNDIYNEYYQEFDDSLEENLANANLDKDNSKKNKKSKKLINFKKNKLKPDNLDDFKFYNDQENKIQEEIEDLLKEQNFN